MEIGIVLACDFCEREFGTRMYEPELADVDEVRDEAQLAGWQSSKMSDLCPDCWEGAS